MEIMQIDDQDLLKEISRRFQEKRASIQEMEFMTKKLLELNEKTKEADEAKTYFLSLIKNEFNNPMTVLLSLVKKVGEATDPYKASRIATMMHKELMYLDFSLKNIFAASEIEYGKAGNSYVYLHPKEIADEVIEYLEPMIGEKLLSIDVYTSIQTMVIDAQKFYLVLLNLLSNGCEFSYPSSTLSISFIEENSEYVIRIANTGEGIHEEHSNNIYNRFYKYSIGKTRPTQGLGLGLSVVKELCESMEGSIGYFEEEGQTIFVARFPVKNEKELSISEGLGSDEFFDSNFIHSLKEF
jgi:signal transduction histidine kinase